MPSVIDGTAWFKRRRYNRAPVVVSFTAPQPPRDLAVPKRERQFPTVPPVNENENWREELARMKEVYTMPEITPNKYGENRGRTAATVEFLDETLEAFQDENILKALTAGTYVAIKPNEYNGPFSKAKAVLRGENGTPGLFESLGILPEGKKVSFSDAAHQSGGENKGTILVTFSKDNS